MLLKHIFNKNRKTNKNTHSHQHTHKKPKVSLRFVIQNKLYYMMTKYKLYIHYNKYIKQILEIHYIKIYWQTPTISIFRSQSHPQIVRPTPNRRQQSGWDGGDDGGWNITSHHSAHTFHALCSNTPSDTPILTHPIMILIAIYIYITKYTYKSYIIYIRNPRTAKQLNQMQHIDDGGGGARDTAATKRGRPFLLYGRDGGTTVRPAVFSLGTDTDNRLYERNITTNRKPTLTHVHTKYITHVCIEH